MGVVTKCCTNQYFYSDIDSPAKGNESQNQNQSNNIILIKKIPEVKDSNQGLNYIYSTECYNIITKISRTIFTKKLCKKMSAEEIYTFLKKIIGWIIAFKYTEKDLIIKKHVSKIQIYTKLGTNKIISELNSFSYKFKKDEEELLLRSLSDWIMLIQLIMSLTKDNLWKKKDMDKNIKSYVFDGIYFLIKIKTKYTHERKETVNLDRIFPIQTNYKINYDTKNEIKNIVALVEDLVIDLFDYK